ncbi:GntR family transcriptional regulator [Allobranchiibius sp. GilTou38]|uniref:GntR family transcriptional regulator n=1 Tax=Allobranchiibius sp. GilTou38 TaxID=2815210 RepID=UPI001AA175C7|nr:GntR family transcriptional regulator [Allobranchiibius sp. GilTou38]MBO1766705.1 GntR family transcriptional regulator [Allobranchiibius sp. GilTou38]
MKSSSGARSLDRQVQTPLWRQLRDDLCRRLEVGEFANGPFPGELSLREQYGVSRHTVREALRQLREDGVVTAVRGRAPQIPPAAQIEQPLGALYSLFAAAEDAGMEQISQVRVLDLRVDEVAAGRLGLPNDVPLLYLERLRLADGEPLALDRVWLPAQLTAPLLDSDFTRTALYDELDRRCAIRLTGGEEHLRAVVPTAPERVLLKIDDRTAAFAIERTGTWGSRRIEWRHTLIRGDRFSVSASFAARTGYRLGVAAPLLHSDQAFVDSAFPSAAPRSSHA